VKRSADGWTAEVRIAAQSLQFPKRNAVWGLNVSRYVPRELMTLVWSGVSLDASPTNLQWEGKLTDVQGWIKVRLRVRSLRRHRIQRCEA